LAAQDRARIGRLAAARQIDADAAGATAVVVANKAGDNAASTAGDGPGIFQLGGTLQRGTRAARTAIHITCGPSRAACDQAAIDHLAAGLKIDRAAARAHLIGAPVTAAASHRAHIGQGGRRRHVDADPAAKGAAATAGTADKAIVGDFAVFGPGRHDNAGRAIARRRHDARRFHGQLATINTLPQGDGCRHKSTDFATRQCFAPSRAPGWRWHSHGRACGRAKERFGRKR
jgi:hypothetical protein